MTRIVIHKIPLNEKAYNNFILYARKDDRTAVSSLMVRAIDYFLTEYNKPPCEHCGKRMQEDEAGPSSSYPILEFEITTDRLDRLNKLARSAKVDVYFVITTAIGAYLKKRKESAKKLTCLHCGSKEYEVRNHDPKWGDGEIHCAKCGMYFRDFDSG